MYSQAPQALRDRRINRAGLPQVEGKTFHWKGYYDTDLNTAHTLMTDLNVFANFQPKLPEQMGPRQWESYTQSDYLFLGNIDPELQSFVNRSRASGSRPSLAYAKSALPGQVVPFAILVDPRRRRSDGASQARRGRHDELLDHEQARGLGQHPQTGGCGLAQREKLNVLRHLTVLEGGKSSVSDLVRQAVDEFLAVHLAKQDAWGQRLDRLVTRVRDRIPIGVSGEDIEADITAASDEVRLEAGAGGR